MFPTSLNSRSVLKTTEFTMTFLCGEASENLYIYFRGRMLLESMGGGITVLESIKKEEKEKKVGT